MSMPKGTKFNQGYATVTNAGKGYREIAEIMTSEGHKMNHATARNKFLQVMEKFAKKICDENGVEGDPRLIARNPQFQAGICEIMQAKCVHNLALRPPQKTILAAFESPHSQLSNGAKIV